MNILVMFDKVDESKNVAKRYQNINNEKQLDFATGILNRIISYLFNSVIPYSWINIHVGLVEETT